MENNQNTIGSKSFTLKKEERLSSNKIIDLMFTEGDSFIVYPLKIVYHKGKFGFKYKIQAAFSVGKRNFRKAFQRNAIKRKLRESYRLNKSILSTTQFGDDLALFFIYIGKEMPDYKQVDRAIIKSLNKVKSKLTTHEGDSTE